METRLKVAERIAQEASLLALDYFRQLSELEVCEKRPQDVFSEADREVENLIRQRLGDHFPQDPVIGEEYGGELSASYWSVDPIDGTSNFLRGSSLWGISVGYVQDGEPVMGVIVHPVLNLMLSGGKERGVYLNGEPFERPVIAGGLKTVAIGDSPSWDFTHQLCIEKAYRDDGWNVVRYRHARNEPPFCPVYPLSSIYACLTTHCPGLTLSLHFRTASPRCPARCARSARAS